MYKAALFLIIASLFAGCLKGNDNNECNYNACTYVAPASETAAVEAYLSANNITAVKHCSGAYYRIEAGGGATKPTACSNVKATYSGKLTSGTAFDAGTATFNLGNVIIGWTNTLPLIGEGGRIHLYIPPSLAYGNQQVGTIPPNSILIFDVVLDDVL